MTISFVVYGNAAPAGSKRHVGGGRIIDSSKRAGPWKQEVAQAASLAYADQGWGNDPRELLTGPLEVQMTFYVRRPRSHFRHACASPLTLKPSAPVYPTTRPDLLKLARAIEDACTGIIWRDDSQIVIEHLHKRYGERVRVEITVRELNARALEAAG